MTIDSTVVQERTAEKLNTIDRLCEELYQENRTFTPMYPWVFVLVCKKEQKVGSLWTPDHKQNKTVHEGIVLATWKPKTFIREVCDSSGRRRDQSETRSSTMHLGDRVIFHHYAGQPVPGYDTERFRVVRERDWVENEQGGIYGRVSYADDQTRPLAQLMLMLQAGEYSESLQSKIADRFLVVDRESGSVTLSGK